MKIRSSLGYTLFKKSLRLTHETLLVRHRFVIGRENLPERGERFFIASNHENTANDPLNIIFSMPDTLPVGSVARANMFQLGSLVTRFLHFIRILPAYRYDWESFGSLTKNFDVNKEISQRVNRGEPFIVFPSAGHSQGHYLLSFTTGIVRMALQTIEDNGWTHDVKIVPTALFYEDYVAPHSDVMWIIGKPLSLLPYKDMYKEHPYTVMRQVRDQLWEQIHGMMLDEGQEDYETVDFLRCAFNNEKTKKPSLPERLQADKTFVANLRKDKHFGMLTAMARYIMQREQAIKVLDSSTAKPMMPFRMFLAGLILVILFPLWLVSLWPHIICYYLPLTLLKDDKMFTSSYRYIISALFLYPLAAIITIVTFAAIGSWWLGLLWVALWIPTGIFCWKYSRIFRRLLDNIRLRMHPFTAAKIRIMRDRVRNNIF